MPRHGILRTNVFNDFFALLTYLMVAVGFSMIAITGQIATPAYFLFLVPFLGRWVPPVRDKLRLSSRQANLYTWIYLPFFIADMLFLSRSFVPATLHLILFIQLLKIYQPKNQRDYFQLMLLSFLMVLAASSLTISSLFLFLFLVFVLLTLATLICFEVKRSVEALPVLPHRMVRANERSPSALAWRQFEPSLQWKAARAVVASAAASLLLILALGTTLFFAIPRIGTGYFQRAIGRKLALSGFSDRIRLGNIGAIQLDPSVVMRVRVQGDPSRFQDRKWRGVALDFFDGKSWSKRVRGASVEFPYAKQFQIRQTPSGGHLLQYQVLLEPASTNYLFTLDRIVWLGGNLHPVRLDAADDSITATYRLNRRLSYQAISVLPPSNPPGEAAVWLAKQARVDYLQLPPLDRRIFQLAGDMTARASTSEEKSRQIESYLQKNYQYSLDADLVETPQPLSAFLFESRKGHCEYFSTAMAVLLRTLGIPTRVVNGFRGGEFNAVGEDFIFRGRDAHSWVEAYEFGRGWQTYDPTPAVENAFPQSAFMATFNNYLDAFELFWGEWILGYDDILQVSLFHDLQEKSNRWWEGTRHGLGSLETRIQNLATNNGKKVLAHLARNRWMGLLFPLMVPAWLGLKMLRRRLGRELRLRTLRGGSEMSHAIEFYRDLLSWLRSRGVVKKPHLTPNEFAESIPDPFLRTEVLKVTSLYNQIRFSPDPVSREQIRIAYKLLSGLRANAKHTGSH